MRTRLVVLLVPDGDAPVGSGPIPSEVAWQPPRRPPARRPDDVRAYREQVRESLETFLNDRLSHLAGTAQGAGWMLQRARVKVTVQGAPSVSAVTQPGDARRTARAALPLTRRGFEAVEVGEALGISGRAVQRALTQDWLRQSVRELRSTAGPRTSFDEVPLSARAANAVHEAGFTTIGDLLAPDARDRLRRLRNTGRTTLAELDEVARTVLGRGLGGGRGRESRGKRG